MTDVVRKAEDDDGEEWGENACYWTADHLPEARPNVDGMEEVLVVHCSGPQLIAQIGDIVEHPESWGVFLSDIARVISLALAEHNDMTVEEAERILRRGFNSGYTYDRRRVHEKQKIEPW